jgi:WhiB family redox-sensing transcriptional regulator
VSLRAFWRKLPEEAVLPCVRQPELFFPEEGEKAPDRKRREQSAKLICAECPHLTACLENVAQSEKPYGVVAGLDEREQRMYQKRGRLPVQALS